MTIYATVYNHGHTVEAVPRAEELKAMDPAGHMIARTDGHSFSGPIYHPDCLFLTEEAARKYWNREYIPECDRFHVGVNP